jgi:hypothetical protein
MTALKKLPFGWIIAAMLEDLLAWAKWFPKRFVCLMYDHKYDDTHYCERCNHDEWGYGGI